LVGRPESEGRAGTMTREPSSEFEAELEVLRTEAEAVTQFFYAFLTIHAVMGDNKKVHRALNQSALLWKTTLGSLQTATFITLGRIFDQGSAHNVDRVLGLAQRYPGIFAKSALGKRKQAQSDTAPSWLPAYLSEAYVPTKMDFRRLRTHVHARRRVYEANYRDLRHKVFAHKELTNDADISALYAKTNIRELQRIVTFLGSLHEALWQLYFNGRKPTLHPRRYSLQRMRDLPSPAERRSGVQERIVHETEQFLVAVAAANQQRIDTEASARRLPSATRIRGA
jgi:AbiU2